LSILHLPITADVLLLYPSDSLGEQITVWAAQHADQRVETSFEHSLPEIRNLLRGADMAMVDATDDPSQATDAFLQAVARLGTAAVAMYSEVMHDGLELFVRVRGSLFLLGPLSGLQWEEYFQRSLHLEGILPGSALRASERPPVLHWPRHRERRLARFVNRFCASFDWPITGMD
jgi:hypothetical protein